MIVRDVGGGEGFASDKTVYTQFRMSASTDAKSWTKIADLTGERRDRPNAYELPRPVKARYIRYEHVYVAATNLAISDIRVFGNGSGKAPPIPRDLTVRRDADPRNALVFMDAGRRSSRLQRAVGNCEEQAVPDVTALRQSGKLARGPRAQCWTGVLVRDRVV